MQKRLPILLFLFVILSACRTGGPVLDDASIAIMETPAADSSSTSFLYTQGNGDVLMSWVEKKDSQAMLKYSTWNGEQFSAPQQITSGKKWFLNWADFPAIASNKQSLLAHFLQKSDSGKFSYDVMLTHAADGKTWHEPAVLHDDGLPAEHGFVSMVPYDKHFFVSWLDGRHTTMDHSSGDGHHGKGSMTLRAAVIDTRGNKLQEWEADNRVCDCCQTSSAITANGPVIVYRDRSEEEIRDISIVRLVNGSWTAPKPIAVQNWKIAGCPVNGPRIAAQGNNLAIAWFSAPESKPQVNVVFSKDGGASFSAPLRIDEGDAVGRVGIAWVDDKTVAVSWLEGDDLKVRLATTGLTTSAPVKMVMASKERAGGFPQMVFAHDKLLLSWTDAGYKKVKAATIGFK
jgi:hypothetical protein